MGHCWKSQFFCPSICPRVSVCISQHMHIELCQGSSWHFFYNSCWRHRGNFWLHLHVKWSMLLCGCEVPPDSPSPVARQTELQLPSSPSFPPVCWDGAWQPQHLKVLSIFSLLNWGQPSEEQQVGKDKHDSCRRTPHSLIDKRHEKDIKKALTVQLSVIFSDCNPPTTVMGLFH